MVPLFFVSQIVILDLRRIAPVRRIARRLACSMLATMHGRLRASYICVLFFSCVSSRNSAGDAGLTEVEYQLRGLLQRKGGACKFYLEVICLIGTQFLTYDDN